MAPFYIVISTRRDFRQVHTAPKTGELARLTTPGIDASRIQRYRKALLIFHHEEHEEHEGKKIYPKKAQSRDEDLSPLTKAKIRNLWPNMSLAKPTLTGFEQPISAFVEISQSYRR